uniref:Putative secreted protein n=1 Tax=Xenopsylla cheopis TaxID=163159 RepID=A0A6M2DYR6_XENCH
MDLHPLEIFLIFVIQVMDTELLHRKSLSKKNHLKVRGRILLVTLELCPHSRRRFPSIVHDHRQLTISK